MGQGLIYNDYFGLTDEPFGVTPDPKFLFMSRAHEEALAHISYGIEHNRGFIMLTGEVGSGKTTLMRHLFDDLGPGYRTAVILNPRMDALELLKFINHDFGISVKRKTTHKSLLDDLNRFLIDCHRKGEKAVLAIDEAQELSVECLEFIRLLSNLETDKRKLLQVILVGQPELREIVDQRRLRQLNQRIAVRYHLGPLKPGETARYVNHRLRLAGALALSFPHRGARMIHRYSGGIPRLINLSADRALLSAFNEGATSIKTSAVREAIRDLEGCSGSGPSPLWRLLVAMLIAAGIGIAIYGIHALLGPSG
jgi:general secretion pathway protein A